VLSHLATRNRVYIRIFVFRPVKKFPFHWNAPYEHQGDAKGNQLPMSLQERVEVPIRQKTGNGREDAPPEERFHHTERIRLREPTDHVILASAFSFGCKSLPFKYLWPVIELLKHPIGIHSHR
jgi:hypothetical protein